MSTKELQKRFRDMGKSDRGSRPVLVQNGGDAGAESEAGRATDHASEHPMMVMVDESTGNKYTRVVDHKRLNGEGDNSWLIKDMHQELKSLNILPARRMLSY